MMIHPVDATIRQTTTIHEHRAPTDDSVRLLKQMEEEAKKKAVESLCLANTPIECVIHRGFDHYAAKALYAIHMKIGGRPVQVTVRLSPEEDRDAAIQKIMDVTSNAIAAEVLGLGFKGIFSKFSQFP